MELNKSKKANINYLAKVVYIKDFQAHRNPEVTRMKVAKVGGYDIIVGLNEQPGMYIYFPTSCVINPELLSFANLYRHTEKNADATKSGFFEDNGRVKAIKLKGQVSEGFLLPFDVLSNFIQNNLNLEITPEKIVIDQEFDQFEHDGKVIWINKKFVVRRTPGTPGTGSREHRNNKKAFDKIIDTQFRFHYDTVQVKKEPWCISPDDIISVTDKWHGTSGISAYVLCKKKPNLFQKIFKIDPGTEYDYIFASRTKVRSEDAAVNDKFDNGIYRYADSIIRPHLIKGMTIYYEICGYYPNGACIQKQGDDYDYGCVPPMEGETFTYEKHFKVMVYRITLTNVDGIIHEFSAKEVQVWCNNEGLTPVIERYYGKALDLYPDLIQFDDKDTFIPDNWNDLFWQKMSNDERFYMEKNSPDCTHKVAHEGVVIKKEDTRSRAWKLKTFAFLNKEQADLDAGIENVEDNA